MNIFGNLYSLGTIYLIRLQPTYTDCSSLWRVEVSGRCSCHPQIVIHYANAKMQFSHFLLILLRWWKERMVTTLFGETVEQCSIFLARTFCFYSRCNVKKFKGSILIQLIQWETQKTLKYSSQSEIRSSLLDIPCSHLNAELVLNGNCLLFQLYYY